MKKGYLKLKETEEVNQLAERLNQHTVRDLAEILSMSTSTIIKIVNYQRVRRSTMSRLSEYLEVDTESISEPA